MCDEFIHPGLVSDGALSRRGFGVMAAAAIGGAALPRAALADTPVVEKDVEVRTPDGLCDAALFHPAGKGRWPAVLIWTDIMGLRPAFRDMGRRMAAAGHVVLVPNPFYRSKRAPVIDGPVDFGDPAQRGVLMGYRAAMGGADARRAMRGRISRSSTRSRRRTARGRRACTDIAWAAASPSRPRRRCLAGWRRWAASTAATASSPTGQTART